MYAFFITGIIIGFSIAAIVGPIGILCIRRSIAQGFAMGMAVGIGAAIADTIYASIAAFGLTMISDFLMHHALILRIIGGSYLLYLGFTTFFSRPEMRNVTSYKQDSYLRVIASTFVLTMTNPVTITAFAVLFASYQIAIPNLIAAYALLSGVFAGSGFWWVLLSSLGSLLHMKLTPSLVTWVNKISGVIIGCFGLITMLILFF